MQTKAKLEVLTNFVEFILASRTLQMHTVNSTGCHHHNDFKQTTIQVL